MKPSTNNLFISSRPLRKHRSFAAFTLVELLVVISIIGLLSAMLVGPISAAYEKKKRSVVLSLNAELVTAIERYKDKYGSYPPDNVFSPNTNSLFYELTGVDFANAPAPGVFTSLSAPGAMLNTNTLYTHFGTLGIANASDPATSTKSKSFITPTASKYAEISRAGVGNVLIFVVPVKTDKVLINGWYYLAAPNAKHNPATFDLWAELYTIKGGVTTTNIIGNWK